MKDNNFERLVIKEFDNLFGKYKVRLEPVNNENDFCVVLNTLYIEIISLCKSLFSKFRDETYKQCRSNMEEKTIDEQLQLRDFGFRDKMDEWFKTHPIPEMQSNEKIVLPQKNKHVVSTSVAGGGTITAIILLVNSHPWFALATGILSLIAGKFLYDTEIKNNIGEFQSLALKYLIELQKDVRNSYIEWLNQAEKEAERLLANFK